MPKPCSGLMKHLLQLDGDRFQIWGEVAKRVGGKGSEERIDPSRSAQIRVGAQRAWDQFYRWRAIWRRSDVAESWRGRLAFVLLSRLYRQMYANTGIATDSARVTRSARRARLVGRRCRALFLGRPMPDVQLPAWAVPPSTPHAWRLQQRIGTCPRLHNSEAKG